MAWGACCGVSAPATALYRIIRQHGRVYGGKCVECIPGGKELLRKAHDARLVQRSHGAFRPVFPNAPDASLTDFDSSLIHNGHTQRVTSCSNPPVEMRKMRARERIPPLPPLPKALQLSRQGFLRVEKSVTMSVKLSVKQNAARDFSELPHHSPERSHASPAGFKSCPSNERHECKTDARCSDVEPSSTAKPASKASTRTATAN